MSIKIKSLITGDGQDTAFLAQLLLSKNHEVIIASRRSSSSTSWKYKELGILNNPDLKFVLMDLLEFHNVNNIIKEHRPDYIFHLAAQSFVQASFDNPIITTQINSLGTLYLLEAIKNNNLYHIRFYNASTSEMYGRVQEIPQKETTPFYPRSPYGVSKLYSHWITKNYREAYGMYACSGILFNHESCLRGSEFVTKKIVENTVRIAKGDQEYFEIGNLDAKRDWGFAGDYVKAMHLMLQQEIPDDYIIATGETHSIREFIEKTFRSFNIDIYWSGQGENEQGVDLYGDILVKVNPKFYRPSEVDILVGDATKAKEKLGWKPTLSFDELIKHMIDYELKNYK